MERVVAIDVDPLDLQRQVEAGSAERAVGLVAQVAPGALVQPHRERRTAVGPPAHERQASAKVSPQHG